MPVNGVLPACNCRYKEKLELDCVAFACDANEWCTIIMEVWNIIVDKLELDDCTNGWLYLTLASDGDTCIIMISSNYSCHLLESRETEFIIRIEMYYF